MKSSVSSYRLTGVGLLLVIALAGCRTPPPPDGLAEAAAMGERPVAMEGRVEFFDGQITATLGVSRGVGPGTGSTRAAGGEERAASGARGGRGRGEGRRAGPPPGATGTEPEAAAAHQRARPATGSPLPPVTTRLKLENRGPAALEIEIVEVNSDLGNFAVRPAKLSLAPGQTAEPDPMISQLGVTADEIPVTVTLRKVAGTAGTPPQKSETRIIAVVSLRRESAPAAAPP